jgi:hypothetical protein
MLRGWCEQAATVEAVPHSQFEQYLRDGKLSDAQVGDRSVSGTLRSPAEGKTRVAPRWWSLQWQSGCRVTTCPTAECASPKLAERRLSWLMRATDLARDMALRFGMDDKLVRSRMPTRGRACS